MDVHNNETLNMYEGEERDNEGYVPLLFVTLPPPQKDSNCLTDMGERTRNLKHPVCTPKIGLSYNC